MTYPKDVDDYPPWLMELVDYLEKFTDVVETRCTRSQANKFAQDFNAWRRALKRERDAGFPNKRAQRWFIHIDGYAPEISPKRTKDSTSDEQVMFRLMPRSMVGSGNIMSRALQKNADMRRGILEQMEVKQVDFNEASRKPQVEEVMTPEELDAEVEQWKMPE